MRRPKLDLRAHSIVAPARAMPAKPDPVFADALRD
jgi:hypothetical protein